MKAALAAKFLPVPRFVPLLIFLPLVFSVASARPATGGCQRPIRGRNTPHTSRLAISRANGRLDTGHRTIQPDGTRRSTVSPATSTASVASVSGCWTFLGRPFFMQHVFRRLATNGFPQIGHTRGCRTFGGRPLFRFSGGLHRCLLRCYPSGLQRIIFRQPSK